MGFLEIIFWILLGFLWDCVRDSLGFFFGIPKLYLGNFVWWKERKKKKKWRNWIEMMQRKEKNEGSALVQDAELLDRAADHE